MLTELKRHWLCACLIYLSLPGEVCSAGPEVLTKLLADRRCDNYVPATPVRQQRAEEAFVSILAGRAGTDPGRAFARAVPGFSARQLDVAGVQWLVLQEDRAACTGQGLYLIREGGSPGLVVQVPHGYHDVHTDDIALGLTRAPVRVIAFNTVPRSFEHEGARIDADLAHRADTLFAALTRAFARALPSGRLVQLHGYSPDKRKSAAAAAAAAIVSAGSSWVTADSEAVADCLRSLLGAPVLMYPDDVRELGGTRNFHGRLLRRYNHNGFVHVELNRMTRDRLRNQDELRTGFARCLANGMVPQ